MYILKIVFDNYFDLFAIVKILYHFIRVGNHNFPNKYFASTNYLT